MRFLFVALVIVLLRWPSPAAAQPGPPRIEIDLQGAPREPRPLGVSRRARVILDNLNDEFGPDGNWLKRWEFFRPADSIPTAQPPFSFGDSARESAAYEKENFPWFVPEQIAIITVQHPETTGGAGGPVTPSDHIVVVNDFEPDSGDSVTPAVNVTDTGFISGFTLIEGGCDFLDDGVAFGGDRCATNDPPTEPNQDWPNVMVQVLDQDGFRFVENGNNPLVRDEARIDKVHVFGGGGPDLVDDDGIIRDFAPATHDNTVQYELISVRVVIRSAVKTGVNLLRDWLLRGPREILAARSERAAFFEQTRPSPSRSTAPAKSRARGALSMLVTSTGNSTGEAFRVQALANRPIAFELTSVVAEPLKGVKPNAIAKAASKFASRGAHAATGIGYCLEFTRQPPSAGMLYRIAGPEIQKRFEPMRRVAHAAKQLSDAGELKPDSEPTSYAHSIAQWAVWTAEQKFTQSSYTQAFVDHTRKAVEAAGRPWQREFAQQIEKAAPNRWQQIQRILRAAGM
jgi:hypothetical protein